ncbi:MAG: peptidase T [Bacteroidetes bacterium]|nr:peptidase T [Bacteroidota bacterium]
MKNSNYATNVTERFLRYIKIDTQSDPASGTFPSTAKQKNLAVILVAELKTMGITDAHLDEWGYVYGTLPGNSSKDVPVIFFCAHMDTSPDCSGTGVNPVIHKNYKGGDIVLPGDPSQVIRLNEQPDLKNQMGNDIVTSDGTTLLGADNKAGVAEIMEAVDYLLKHPDIQHGTVKILFTPDEEIGRGVDKVDLKKLGAQFGYTMDGESLGNIEDETFSADGATITVHGRSTHPGFAKGKMENAIKIAAEIIHALPKEKFSPETTSGREGYVHPVSIEGGLEKAVITFIVRDFDTPKLKEHESILEKTAAPVLKNYKHSSCELYTWEQYRNMKSVLDQYPHVVSYAEEAMRRSGITPNRESIRGGTDGSRLSFMGLP